MKAFVLTEQQWNEVWESIKKSYSPSVFLSREKMRKTLGFTHREHEEWIVFDHTGDRERRMLKKTIHVDFYSEEQRTMFLLKYAHLFKEPCTE